MLEQLTSSQLSEWVEYDRMDPIGELRNDYRFSYMFSLMTNLVIRAVGKQGAKLTSVKDFEFPWNVKVEDKTQQSAEDMKTILLAFTKSHNRKEAKKQKI